MAENHFRCLFVHDDYAFNLALCKKMRLELLPIDLLAVILSSAEEPEHGCGEPMVDRSDITFSCGVGCRPLRGGRGGQEPPPLDPDDEAADHGEEELLPFEDASFSAPLDFFPGSSPWLIRHRRLGPFEKLLKPFPMPELGFLGPPAIHIPDLKFAHAERRAPASAVREEENCVACIGAWLILSLAAHPWR